jgi:uncharacterized membrane protein
MTRRDQGPDVNRISLDDLNEVLVAGMEDFREAPTIGLAIGAAFAVAGWFLIYLVWSMGFAFLAYPLAFYAVSDLRERRQPPTMENVVPALRKAAGRDFGSMALVTGFALVIWLLIAAVLTFVFGGINTFDEGYLTKLFETPSGLAFLALGNITGALIAFAVFSISVVSFPMLYDRDTDFVTAMSTSVRLVAKNRVSMLAWCMFIGITIAISVMSAFVALTVLLPLVGHATWHLYRRAVGPSPATDVPALEGARSAAMSNPVTRPT